MTLLDDLQTHLQGDPGVVAPGGVHIVIDPDDDRPPLDARSTPEAFDSAGRIKRCVLLTLSSWPRFGPYANSSKAFILAACYAPTGSEAEELAGQVIQSLNDQMIGNSPSVRWLEDVGRLPGLDRTFKPNPEIVWTSRFSAVVERGAS
jgi:hypothetical protein